MKRSTVIGGVLALSGCSLLETTPSEMLAFFVKNGDDTCYFSYDELKSRGGKVPVGLGRKCAELVVAATRSEFYAKLEVAQRAQANNLLPDDPMKQFEEGKFASFSANYSLTYDCQHKTVVADHSLTCYDGTATERDELARLVAYFEDKKNFEALILKIYASAGDGKPQHLRDFWNRYAAFTGGHAPPGWVHYRLLDRQGKAMNSNGQPINSDVAATAKYVITVQLLDHAASAEVVEVTPEYGRRLVRTNREHNYEYDALQQELRGIEDELRYAEQRNRYKADNCSSESSKTGLVACVGGLIAEDQLDNGGLRKRKGEVEDSLSNMSQYNVELVTADYQFEALQIKATRKSTYRITVTDDKAKTLGTGQTSVVSDNQFSVYRGQRCDDVRFFNEQGQRRQSCDQRQLSQPKIAASEGDVLIPDFGLKTPATDDDIIRHVVWSGKGKGGQSVKEGRQ